LILLTGKYQQLQSLYYINNHYIRPKQNNTVYPKVKREHLIGKLGEA
jgi:hypothetical protein